MLIHIDKLIEQAKANPNSYWNKDKEHTQQLASTHSECGMAHYLLPQVHYYFILGTAAHPQLCLLPAIVVTDLRDDNQEFEVDLGFYTLQPNVFHLVKAVKAVRMSDDRYSDIRPFNPILLEAESNQEIIKLRYQLKAEERAQSTEKSIKN